MVSLNNPSFYEEIVCIFFLVSRRFLSSFSIQGFEPEWLYTGENFGKVLNTLLAFNFATQGKCFHLSFIYVIHSFAKTQLVKVKVQHSYFLGFNSSEIRNINIVFYNLYFISV